MAEIDDDRVQPALIAMLGNDPQALQAAVSLDPEIVAIRWGENTLLEWVTQPPHGVSAEVVDVLIGAGSELDRALNLAACWNLGDLCGRLLSAGADPAARADAGITPLESAALHGSVDSADVVVGWGLHRPCLWLAAATGLRDEVERWVAPEGALRREAGSYRPNLADVGHPPAAEPPSDAPVDIISEAFVFAAANGRGDVSQYLLSAGADIDARPYLNTTALHLAVLFRQPTAVADLLAWGASTDIEDERFQSTAHGWAQACLGDDAASAQVIELLAP